MKGGKSMKKTFLKRLIVLVTTVAMLFCMLPTVVMANGDTAPAIDPSQFKNPGMEYRPGVRWWWPGGAVEADELVREINLLADNGFGYAEINPFGGGLDATYGDNAPHDKYGTDEYYEALEAAVAQAAERGLKIDLNMGSGWNANDPSVTIDESMGNMAIGRSEVTINSDDVGKVKNIEIPEMIVAPSYNTDSLTEGGETVLQALVIAKIKVKLKDVITRGTLSGNPTEDQILIDPANIISIDLSDGSKAPGDTVEWIPEEEGEYAVISYYVVPTGCRPIDSVNKSDAFVIDHMNKDIVYEYMENWMGEGSKINEIAKAYPGTIRAYFNDSYEFYGDVFYNSKLYENAKDESNNILGYDLTPYLPTIYKVYNAWPHYRARSLATNDSFYSISNDAYEKNTDVADRITYDYQLLVNQLFQEGMEAFSNKAREYNAVYRQQAYNPPIDTIGSAKYVDIPEGEQLNENTLKIVSSGAHLYNRPLVTAEQYTLGCTPFKNTWEAIKNGFDLMATSGVNNFFYHGFNYRYFGNEIMQQESAYGENGYTAFFSIGINVGEANSLWPYFKDLNAYASRVNYLMQQGNPSVDVALYVPFNGSVSNSSGAAKELNENGYTWDAINDDAIQNMAVWDDVNKVIKISGSEVTYKAIIVQDKSLPVQTVRALQSLAEDGAPVIFYGENLPSRHPGFAGGKYAELDAEINSIVNEMITNTAQYPEVEWITAGDSLADVLGSTGKISYEKNANLRFIRRTLSDGGELVYFRNTATTENTVTIEVSPNYKNCYWLDQNTGNIYRANVKDGKITVTLPASQAIALLCEPEGVSYDESVISGGTPMTIDTRPLTAISTLDDFTLTVTADNIGSYKKGDITTKTYTDDVLGNWKLDTFQNGDLKYVNAPGIYETTLTIDDISEYSGKSIFLDLGTVHTVAEVRVNGQHAGTLMYSPYKLDITEYLQQGDNEIEIKVTPRTYNRYIGFSVAYKNTTGDEQKTYQYYKNISVAESNYVDAGLIGPVTLFEAPQNEFTVNTTFTVGEKVNATKLEANAMLDASAVITNNGSDSKQVLLIVALYDSSNRMVNVSYLAKEVAAGATENFHAGFKLPSNVAGYKAKAFVWEGESLLSTNMEPVSNVAEITD